MNYDDLLEKLAIERAAEVEANRLELTLWTLARGTERVEARTRRHPRGIELIVVIDAELHYAESFTSSQLAELDRREAELRRDLEMDGWSLLGPLA